jgi:hypothetical protein
MPKPDPITNSKDDKPSEATEALEEGRVDAVTGTLITREPEKEDRPVEGATIARENGVLRNGKGEVVNNKGEVVKE